MKHLLDAQQNAYEAVIHKLEEDVEHLEHTNVELTRTLEQNTSKVCNIL